MFKKGDRVLVEAMVNEDHAIGSEDVLVSIKKHGGDRVGLWVDNENIATQPNWIPVEDRLPDTDKNMSWQQVLCLCQWSGGQIESGCFDGKHFQHADGDMDYHHEEKVVAWQPLPAPYEPPVKPRESCEGCKHHEIWFTGFGSILGGGGDRHPVSTCRKFKTVCSTPWTTYKPCHED